MAPKKATTGGDANELLVGFADRETKLIAAAFLSTTGPDKFDYDLMATLTGNTAGSLKKMWPPVKRKAMDSHPSFAKFLGQSASEAPKSATIPKSKKRKASDEVPDEASNSETEHSDSAKKPLEKKPVANKKGCGRPKKHIKSEDADTEEHTAESDNGLHSETEKSV